MEAKAKVMIEDAVAYAEQAPYPEPDEARHPVYAEEIIDFPSGRPTVDEKEASHA
jgi:TPP-dependent pyruvate/acetoin dehydrogenase alpha subunit